MIVTVRKFDPEQDAGLLEFQDKRTLVRTGSSTMAALFEENGFRNVFLPDGLWVAFDGDEAIGAILFGKYREPDDVTAAIYGIKVEEPYRRRGIGGTLMYKAEIFAAKNGLERLILHTRRDNEAAMTLFKKCWYKVIDESGETLTMEKKLLRRRR